MGPVVCRRTRALPALITLCPCLPSSCAQVSPWAARNECAQVCVECAGDTNTSDESLLLSIAPVWEMSLGLQGSQPALVHSTHALCWCFSQGDLV